MTIGFSINGCSQSKSVLREETRVGTLSKDDDKGSENASKKNEFAFFQT